MAPARSTAGRAPRGPTGGGGRRPAVTSTAAPTPVRPGSGTRRSTSSRSCAPPPGAVGHPVPATLDTHRRGEVLVEVVDVLDPSVLERAADGDEVEHGEMLHHLAQADAAGVRAHRHAELGRQEQDGEVLVHAADPAGVDLDDVDRLGLQQLLEDHTVLHVLAGCDRESGAPPRGSSDGRGCRRARSAPRSSTDRTPRVCPSTRWPGRRPSAGWRRGRCAPPSPTATRATLSRRMSDATSAPTFSLSIVNPSATDWRASRATLSSS